MILTKVSRERRVRFRLLAMFIEVRPSTGVVDELDRHHRTVRMMRVGIVTARIRIIEAMEIRALYGFVLRQLQHCLRNGEPLPLASDSPWILPFRQFIRHSHNPYLRSVLVFDVLSKNYNIKYLDSIISTC